jgi:hypothetical protein
MTNSLKMKIEKFKGQSFELWKFNMKNLLVDRDQWIVVDSGTAFIWMFSYDWKKLDKKAKSTIRLCFLDSMLLNLSREATTKEL